jgi:hypothetical protein
MSIVSKSRTWRLGFLAVVAVASSAASAWAVVPVPQPPPFLTPVLINGSAGDQSDPHVSGDWAAYTDFISIRYYRFSTFTDAAIPLGSSARDLLSDVSGSRIVFSRVITGVKNAVMVFDAATAGPAIEIDAATASNRLGSAIGGNTVAYVDFGLHANGELVIHDLVTSTSVRITTDTAFDQNPSVSPSGDIVVWEHCLTSSSNCDIWQAIRTGPAWSVSVASGSLSAEGNPDTNGTLVVYDSFRAGNADIFWRPAAGGAEVQLEMSGFELNPGIAGDFIAFESRPTLFDTTDLFIYDTANNRLFQITDTPLITEQLSDIAVLPDGRLRTVWSSDEDGFDQRNVWSATFRLPNLAPTLAHSAEPGYGTDGVSPDSGTTATTFTYKVVYTDADDEAPSYVDVCIDAACHGMTVDTTAAAALRDSDFRNGEQYAYATTLAAGSHAYHFEASDDIDTARLPAVGALAGPSVTGGTPEISIDDIAVTEGDSGFRNAVFTVSLSEPSSQPVTVWYLTWLGTALPFADFVPGLGRITIAPQQLQAAITVRVRGEVVVESDETFYVVLFWPHGATIDDGIGQGTIVNDDP